MIRQVLLIFGFVFFAMQSEGQDMPSSSEARNAPIVFIPGILGSKICQDDKEIWSENIRKIDFKALELTEQAKETQRPCGLYESAFLLFDFIDKPQYGPTREFLESRYKDPTTNMLVFDYDWRLSNFDNAEKLREEIKAWKEKHEIQEYDILAHSMGGIIAAIFTYSADDKLSPERVLTFGTPFQGSASILKPATGASDWRLRDLIVSKALQRQITLSWPSTYELMPRSWGTRSHQCGRYTMKNNRPNVVSYDCGDIKFWESFTWFEKLPEFTKDTIESQLSKPSWFSNLAQSDTALSMTASDPFERTGFSQYFFGFREPTDKLFLVDDSDQQVNCQHWSSIWRCIVPGDGTVINTSATFTNVQRAGSSTEGNHLGILRAGEFDISRLLSFKTIQHSTRIEEDDPCKNPIFSWRGVGVCSIVDELAVDNISESSFDTTGQIILVVSSNLESLSDELLIEFPKRVLGSLELDFSVSQANERVVNEIDLSTYCATNISPKDNKIIFDCDIPIQKNITNNLVEYELSLQNYILGGVL